MFASHIVYIGFIFLVCKFEKVKKKKKFKKKKIPHPYPTKIRVGPLCVEFAVCGWTQILDYGHQNG